MSDHTCGGKPSMSCTRCMEDYNPEHCNVPVDIHGNGPAEPKDTVGEACWCGSAGCTLGQRDDTRWDMTGKWSVPVGATLCEWCSFWHLPDEPPCPDAPEVSFGDASEQP
jgi:hypothetical protein